MSLKKNPSPATGAATPAVARILDVAEQLVQTRGFNAFSYADIADELLVTKASLHYYFPAKADLGRALIERYHVVFVEALAAIDRQTRDSAGKLRRYVALYAGVLRNDRMCLCGMLAAEYATLPEPMQAALIRFFDANEVWLTAVCEAGRRSGDLTFRGSAKLRARSLLGGLEGAMLVARAYGDSERFTAVAKQVLADLKAGRAEALDARPAALNGKPHDA